MNRLRRLTPTICAFHLGFGLGGRSEKPNPPTRPSGRGRGHETSPKREHPFYQEGHKSMEKPPWIGERPPDPENCVIRHSNPIRERLWRIQKHYILSKLRKLQTLVEVKVSARHGYQVRDHSRARRIGNQGQDLIYLPSTTKGGKFKTEPSSRLMPSFIDQSSGPPKISISIVFASELVEANTPE